jgi:hypothetical protein
VRRRCAILLSSLALAWIAPASTPACLQPATMDYLAGHDREFGAVGAPDSDEMTDPAAHCDNADHLAGSYPFPRDTAVTALRNCVAHLRAQFREGLDSAEDLLDDRGQVIPEEVSVSPECNPREREESRTKCRTLEAFGRVLHGVQDFYAHSNWADRADPARPVGADNPPGLHRPGPSYLLDLRGTTDVRPPADFTTGCYVLQDRVPGVGACQSRITHAALNKDRGLIDPVDGRATEPATARGRIGDNFSDAVAGAIAESRRQWRDFQTGLTARYGVDRGARMVCVLTHDDPLRDCGGPNLNRVAVIVLLTGAALAVVAGLARHSRTRIGG